jgi:hypothetical protein
MDEQIDAEILQLARRHVAEKYGIAPTLAGRLHGSTLKGLEQDAARLREDLGLGPLNERDRDERGRFSGGSSDFNHRIRAAIGR